MDTVTTRNFALYSVILASVSIAPLFEAQRVLNMSVLHPISLAGPALLLIFSLLGAALLTRIGERSRSALFAFITVVYIDMMFGGHALLIALVEPADFLPRVLRSAIKIIFILGLFALIFLALWQLGKNAVPVLATIFATTMVSGLFLQVVSPLANGLEQPAGWPGLNREPIRRSEGAVSTVPAPLIHIVLDEMMAPEAIDLDLPGGAEVYRKITEFHERFGFRLYGRVFSRRFLTIDSLPDLLNYDFVGVAPPGDLSNIHFSEMAQRGYDIVVYQSSHVDHCTDNAVTNCNTFYSFNPTTDYYLGDFEFRFFVRHIMAIFSTMNDSYIRRMFEFYIDFVTDFSMDDKSYFSDRLARYDVHAFPRWFDKFADDLIADPDGKFVFAHFLVPHAPYILNSDCTLAEDLSLRSLVVLSVLGEFDEETILHFRSKIYQRYFEQVSCAYSKLTILFEMMAESGRFETATIVIHGDHGSRNTTTWDINKMTEREIVDNFSTIFAIRSPGVEPGYDRRFVSIQQLFAEFFAPQPVEPTIRATVVGRLGHYGDQVGGVEVNMPEFGLTRSTTSTPHQPQSMVAPK